MGTMVHKKVLSIVITTQPVLVNSIKLQEKMRKINITNLYVACFVCCGSSCIYYQYIYIIFLNRKLSLKYIPK